MAHDSTVLGQLLDLVPRREFQELAERRKSGRRLRVMTRWSQFVAMAMAQLAGRCSLRDIVSNLAAQGAKLRALGAAPVARSSLARINESRSYALYEELFGLLLARCRARAPGHGFRFRNPLISLDSTSIDVCLSAFEWAAYRKTKGAVKLHLGLDHGGMPPAYACVTDGRTADIEAARRMEFPAGSIVVADRAHVAFDWIHSLASKGVHLVTRMKDGIRFRVVERRGVDRTRGVTSDWTIGLTSDQGREACPRPLRRIGYRDPETGKQYFFLTTNFDLSPRTIADIHEARWQVELFFKWLKQNLKASASSAGRATR